MKRDSGTPILKDLVLVGGGHSHIAVLRAFGMRPVEGCRLTLISPDSHTAYSGMLPGLIAGHYRYDDTHIDLAKLTGFAGARFLRADVTGLDPVAKTVILKDRPAIRYDIVSLNIGSSPPVETVPGALDHALPVKPVAAFLDRWAGIEAALEASSERQTLAVVGAGAGGLELAMAIRYRFRDRKNLTVTVFEASTDILSGFVSTARNRVRRNLQSLGIGIVTGQAVTKVSADRLELADGTVHPAGHVFWTTGAKPPDWFSDTGLELDKRNFLATRPTLQCHPFDNVFAVGDCATMTETPRPKAGVFAVRQGPVLAENLRRLLLDRPPAPYRPQKNFLTILATGRQHAVAVKGPFAVEGDWVWRWKNHIDRAFMDRFSVFPAMANDKPSDRLPDLPADPMYCAGCGSKLPASALSRTLERLGVMQKGMTGDDAAVFDPPAGRQLAVSVDHFPAIVDDPYAFGRIAANHALGDLYAMGATPLSALAIVTVPRASADIAESDLFQLLSGAMTVFNAEGVRLLGGHSTEGDALALGFSVTGAVQPGKAIEKGGLNPGDVLILTKPLGTGVIFAAAAQGKARGRWIDGALASMSRSLAPAMAVVQEYGATGLTDVTGFGLAGHLAEMLDASKADAVLEAASLSALDGAIKLLSDGYRSSLAPANAKTLSTVTDIPREDFGAVENLLCDPQTAGGLLAGVPADRADACLAALRAAGDGQAAVIGRVEPMSGTSPRVILR
ncbi:MAG: selenide, water dikinase SelD [Alphaproteobacteria bacterium]